MTKTRVQPRQSILSAGMNLPTQSATAPLLNQMAQATNELANEMTAKADVMYINTFLTESRKQARTIFEKNQDNPDQLREELDSYKKGLMSSMPGRLTPRLETEYGALSEQYVNKAITIKNKMLTIEQSRALQENENRLINDIAFSSEELAISITDPNLSDADRQARGLAAQGQIAISMTALQNNLATIGADGNPLRTDKEINRSLQKAKESMGIAFGKSWLSSQPDKLKAYSDWLDDKVSINLPDGKVNVRQGLSFEVRQKVDKDLINTIKNDIYIDNQIADRQEKALEDFADETKKILFNLSKTGELTPDQVESARNVLKFQDYQDFSIMAREADPITNGTVYGNLVNKIDQGIDVTEEIRKERFINKTLSNDDFEHLLDQNELRTKGAKAPLPEPIKQGRDFLLGSLGGDAEILDIAGSATLAKAERDYNGRIQDFIDKEGRKPSRDEAMNIADITTERYTLLSTNEYAQTLPKPKYMDLAVKVKGSELTVENVNITKEKTKKAFLAKHNGNVEAMKKDPELLEELKLIEKFNALAKQNEIKRARRRAK